MLIYNAFIDLCLLPQSISKQVKCLKKPLLRTASALLILSGLLRSIFGWLISERFSDSSFFHSFPGWVDTLLVIFYSVFGIFGLAALAGQRRTRRHWLGVVSSLFGLTSSLLLYLFTQFFLPNILSNFVLDVNLLVAITTLPFILGFALWIFDLPNTSQYHLQKVSMGALALFPFFGQFLLDSMLSSGSVSFFLIEGVLEGGLWMLLGGSVWPNHAPTKIDPSPSSDSFATSSFELIKSSIPPSEI